MFSTTTEEGKKIERHRKSKDPTRHRAMPRALVDQSTHTHTHTHTHTEAPAPLFSLIRRCGTDDGHERERERKRPMGYDTENEQRKRERERESTTRPITMQQSCGTRSRSSVSTPKRKTKRRGEKKDKKTSKQPVRFKRLEEKVSLATRSRQVGVVVAVSFLSSW